MNRYLPILLLVISYQVGEMYSFWQWDDPVLHNWILFRPTPMNTAWNVKYLSEEINRVLEGVAFYIIARKVNEKAYIVTTQIYLVYRSLDVVFYFISFKTFWYNWIWVLLVIIELWVTRKQKK